MLWAFLAAGLAVAQENASLNTYTPYSMYGFGDMVQPGFTAAGAMGGITVGVRDVRQVDYVNPAAATARDSVLNFALDFGGEMRSYYSRNAATRTSYNTGNFRHLAAGFRIKNFGANFGIVPFSRVGYEVEQREKNDTIVATAGDVRYKYRGEDGINQVFFNVGCNVTPALALGVGAKYYFGSISRYFNTEYASSNFYSNRSSDILRVSNVVPVLGAHYTLNLNKAKGRHAVFGAAFQPGVNMNVKEKIISEVWGVNLDVVKDTTYSVKTLMPMQLNVGASLVSVDRWMLGAEFSYQDFAKTEVLGHRDMGTSYSVKLGGYYIPNMYDVRYFYKRLTYRGGVRYSRTPFMFQQHEVSDVAVTAGISMPMRGAGYLSIGAEVGRRGATNFGMVQETYVTFSLSVTLFESWFRQYQYE